MSKTKDEVENGGQPGEAVKIGTVVGVSTLGIDYDMEEGEIIEDDVVAAGESIVTEKLRNEDNLDMVCLDFFRFLLLYKFRVDLFISSRSVWLLSGFLCRFTMQFSLVLAKSNFF